MFFCCVSAKSSLALEFFNKMCSRQDLFDKRLQSIEKKLNSLTQGVNGMQESDEMSTDANETNGELPRPDILPRMEPLSAGGTSSVWHQHCWKRKVRKEKVESYCA